MPVKAKAAAKSKAVKANEKAKIEQKKKVVEDKTFGLKNKNKSTKVQKYIQTQVSAVDHYAKQKNLLNDPDAKKEKKKMEEERQRELDELFKVAVKQPKLPVGVDPKSVICEAFRQGCCAKGSKCKYSHDMDMLHKRSKIDLYTDKRDVVVDSEDMDEEELKKLVEEKHGKENANKPQTSIICKYFLEAVEKRKYGFFWKCPNGDKCIYRHALPQGYVLKSQMAELLDEELEKQPDISEQIEVERQKVDAKTKITEEVFNKWKLDKVSAKNKALQELEAERKKRGMLNGREIFLQQGFAAVDDASASDLYLREEDVEAEIQAIEEKAKTDYQRALEEQKKIVNDAPSTSADADADADAAGPSTTLNLGEIDENLFLEGSEEELEELEQEILDASLD